MGVSRRSVFQGWAAALVVFCLSPFSALRRDARAAAATQRWICTFNECEHWVWDPLHGDPPDVAGRDPIPAGVAFEDLPDDWRCPVCGAPKSYFEPTDKPWKPMA